MLRTRIPTKVDSLTQAPGILPRNRWAKWSGVFVAIGFALCLSVSAKADAVSGRVYGPDEKVLPKRTFMVETGRVQVAEFTTDESGNFSVYLDPGRHTVHPKGDTSLEGVIESYPQPVHQDIHLKKAER